MQKMKEQGDYFYSTEYSCSPARRSTSLHHYFRNSQEREEKLQRIL